MSTVLLSVGDASGDVVAGDFVRELRALRPGARFLGMGGDEMARAGVELVVHQREMAVNGLFELIPELPRIVRAWQKMVAALRASRPDLVVLVDSSGFNLPFARRAQRLGIPTLYYVAPQVWGWRTGRIHKIARRVDRLAVIFPFEPDVYAQTHVPVEFVGHPLAERLADAREKLDRTEARRGLGLPPDVPVVALLPGSRSSELRRILPLQLAVAKVLHARDPRIHFMMPRAPSVARDTLMRGIEEASLPSLLPIEVIDDRTYAVLAAADAALCKPGTSTLEAALLGCPLVVAARSSWLTSFLVRRLVRIDTLVMPNLIVGESVIPEFYQQDADPQRVADALLAVLSGPERERQLRTLEILRERLARGGAARRAAEIASEMIVDRIAA